MMATTKVIGSKQKKLTTPTPIPSDSRRQTPRPSPSSSTRSSRSTSPTSPKRGRSLAASTGTKPRPNYLKHTESSRTNSASLTDSSSKLQKKHTSASTIEHGTKAASNRRRSIDRCTSFSALSSSHVHSKVGTSGPPIREHLATRSTSFTSGPAHASPKVSSSKAPKATTTVVSNKSHSSSGSGRKALKGTIATFKKENLKIETSDAVEKASGVASIGNEQTPVAEAIKEQKDIEQYKFGDSEEEIVQELETPHYSESEDIIEIETENTKEDILEPIEASHDADQIKQIEEIIEDEKILEPDNNNNNNVNHEDSEEEMDDVKGESKTVSPSAKSSSNEETESKAEDNHDEDADEKLDHAMQEEENSSPVVDKEEEYAEYEAESCKEKEGVVIVKEESPAVKPATLEEPPKTSMDASKGTRKKDSPAYNDVIEETASKLLEKRKNKVKALVGAFETVISLDAN